MIEERQPHLRGGVHEPLSRGDIEEKFALNARHGGWDAERTEGALALLRTLYDGKLDLSSLRGVNDKGAAPAALHQQPAQKHLRI